MHCLSTHPPTARSMTALHFQIIIIIITLITIIIIIITIPTKTVNFLLEFGKILRIALLRQQHDTFQGQKTN